MKISILGCGWLGLPLARQLTKRDHQIKGSTTSRNKLSLLRSHSIESYLLKLSPQLNVKQPVTDFWNSDTLVLNIPPGRGRDDIIDYHSRQIQAVIEALDSSPIEHVVFVSSTSVYPPHPGKVEEADTVLGKAGRASGNALLKAEQLLGESSSFKTTVLRFGGLYGGDRHPVKYMAGRKELGKANAPVNLIHRADCIAIITQIIEEGIWGEIFNAVGDGHPIRQPFYTKAAEAWDLKPPTFKEDHGQNYKYVLNNKLKKELRYTFKYPDPLQTPAS